MESKSAGKNLRNDRRRELKSLNISVWEGATDVFPVATNLDTSLKKNTGFTKRCRVGLAEDQQALLLKEVSTLSLEKYMSEIIADFTEGLTKFKSSADLFTGVEVASALHQRFGARFSGPLLANFLAGISNPAPRSLAQLTKDAQQKEAQTRTDRHKIVLRVLVELWMVGVFRYTTDAMGLGASMPEYAVRKTPSGSILPPPLAAMKEVFEFDKEYFTTGSIAVMLMKNYGSVLIGIKKQEGSSDQEVVAKELQDKFRAFFNAYTTIMQTRVVEVAKWIRRLERRNEDVFIRTGKILDERKVQYDDLYKTAEEMTTNCQSLSDYLGLEMPELRLTNETAEEVLIRKGGTVIQASDSGIWDDDEQRKFYEDLPNLKVLVQGDSDKDEKKSEETKSAEGGGGGEEEEGEDDDKKYDSDDEENAEDQAILKELDEMMDKPEEDDQSQQASGAETDTEDEVDQKQEQETGETEQKEEEGTAGQQMQALLLKLSAQTSRDVVDECARNFLQLNNKASRNRVLKFLTEVPIAEEYKLPFYTRFIAALNPICPEITQGIIDYLDDFFRYLQKKRKIGALFSRRIFNVRYISELTKFALLPRHVIFNKFKMMTERMDGNNVQPIASLLEGCGRYLLRNPETNVLMTKMLQILDKQKNGKYLTIDQKAVIDGALAYVRPDPDAQVVHYVKNRSVFEQYIRQLVYIDLTEESASAVLTQLRRLDWSNDLDTQFALKKVFAKVHKVRYANLSPMAWLVNKLGEYYPWLVKYVVDSLLEGIRAGLEVGTFTMNQQRVSQVCFLSELLARDMVSRDLVFETLYSFITFGHPGGSPKIGNPSSVDPPNEYFRIRLICTVLEQPHAASKLDDGKNGKLDLFLAFLQYYTFCKNTLSMDVQFQIHDVFNSIRPKLKMHKTAKAAAAGLNKAIARANGMEVEDSDSETTEEPIYDEDHEDEETEEERLEREEKQRIKNLEAKRVHAQKEDMKASAEFERDFKQLMVDRVNNKPDRAQVVKAFDEPLPSRSLLRGAHEVVDMRSSSNGSGNVGKTSYTLITKKGAKQQATALAIPSDSKFAQSVADEQERRRAEHNVIKQRVLQYSSRQSNEQSDDRDLPQIQQPQISSTKYTRRVIK